MLRCFFNVHDLDGILFDPEGIEFSDLQAARRAAIAAARSILAEDVTRGHLDLNGWIEVISAGGDILDIVTFSECVTVVGEGQKALNSRWSA